MANSSEHETQSKESYKAAYNQAQRKLNADSKQGFIIDQKTGVIPKINEKQHRYKIVDGNGPIKPTIQMNINNSPENQGMTINAGKRSNANLP